MVSADRLDDTLEKTDDQSFDILDLADFENFLELCQEKRLFDTVCEGPVLEQTLQERERQGTILGQEEHRASEELLVELTASLDLVERDDDVLKEEDVLVSERDGKSGNDACKDVKQLSGAIEFVIFVNQRVETLVHCFSDHFSPWHELKVKISIEIIVRLGRLSTRQVHVTEEKLTYLGIELMEYVLQVVSLHGLLWVEEVEELLDELGSDVDLELTHLDRLVDHELEEELIDTLQMGPGGVDLFFSIETGLCKVQIVFLDIGQRAEDVLLNHLHDLIEARNDDTCDIFLVLKHRLKLIDDIKALSLNERKLLF